MWNAHPTGYMIDWYSVFEISNDADTETIKRVMEGRFDLYTPDVGPLPYIEGIEEYIKQRIMFLEEGYKLLTDSLRRAKYDQLMANWEGPITHHGFTPIHVSGQQDLPIVNLFDVAAEPTVAGEYKVFFCRMTGFDPKRQRDLERRFHLMSRRKRLNESLVSEYTRALESEQQYHVSCIGAVAEVLGLDIEQSMSSPPIAEYRNTFERRLYEFLFVAMERGLRVHVDSTGEVKKIDRMVFASLHRTGTQRAEVLCKAVMKHAEDYQAGGRKAQAAIKVLTEARP